MPIDLSDARRPGLFRRLAALFYDGWLIAALWLLGAAIDAGIRSLLGGRPGEGGHLPLTLYLLATPVLFHAWFWTHGGQTLGMRAWRLRLVDTGGEPVGWRAALLRCAAALLSWGAFGLGYLWVLVDPERAAWHDRLSSTRLVMTRRDA